MDSSGLSREFWGFCSKVIDRLKSEPYLLFVFATFVCFDVLLSVQGFQVQMASLSAYVVAIVAGGWRFNKREQHAAEMERLEIEKTGVRGKARLAELIAKRQPELDFTASEPKSMTENLPQPGSLATDVPVANLLGAKVKEPKP